MSLIMGISGDHNFDDFFCHRTYTEGGKNTVRFYMFMKEFIEYLEVRFPGEKFLITMDTLNIHKVAIILALIDRHGHRVVYRAPSWYRDGTIEYIFNTLQTKIQMCFNAIRDFTNQKA
jgi:hypothetical protein